MYKGVEVYERTRVFTSHRCNGHTTPNSPRLPCPFSIPLRTLLMNHLWPWWSWSCDARSEVGQFELNISIPLLRHPFSPWEGGLSQARRSFLAHILGTQCLLFAPSHCRGVLPRTLHQSAICVVGCWLKRRRYASWLPVLSYL